MWRTAVVLIALRPAVELVPMKDVMHKPRPQGLNGPHEMLQFVPGLLLSQCRFTLRTLVLKPNFRKKCLAVIN